MPSRKRTLPDHRPLCGGAGGAGVRSEKRANPGYAATGNGGQVLLVIPELELAVVFTGENYRQGSIWGRWGNKIGGGAIVPAIRS